MRERMKEKVLEVKRTLVLEGVSSYFEEVGFYESTMNDIAKAIGMSVGALYKFFPSKEELFYGYIIYQIELFYEELSKATVLMENPEAKIIHYLRMKFGAFQSKRKAIEDPVMGDPLFFAKMNVQKNNPALPVFEWLARAFEEYARQEGIALDNPMKTAYLFNGLSNGYVEYWLSGDMDFEETAESILKHFFHGYKS